jgi:hypothetical protein
MARVSLGADPEFGYFVERKTEFTDGLHDDCCDNEEALDAIITKKSDLFGTDGCDCVGEIRPRFAYTANGLNRNIRATLRFGLNKCGVKCATGIGFNGGSISNGIEYRGLDGDSIGGHIHFGVPYDEKLMWRLMLPSVFLLYLEKNPRNIQRRSDHEYGKLNDYRDQRHGFEYRVPCSWITDPQFSLGVLSLYHSVVRAHVDKTVPLLYHSLVRFFLNNKDTDDLIDKHACFDRVFWNKYIVSIIDAIKLLPDYRRGGVYKTNIDYLFNMFDSRRTISERRDLFSSWGLR